MWNFNRKTAEPRLQPNVRAAPAPLPRVLIPFDHDDDEDDDPARRARRRRGPPWRLLLIALLVFGAWLIVPPPVSDASPRVAAVRAPTPVVAVPVAVVPFQDSDTMYADTGFLSDSAIIAAAAAIEAKQKAEEEAILLEEEAVPARQSSQATSATDAATERLTRQRLTGVLAGMPARSASQEPSTTDAATERLMRQRLTGVLARSMPPIDSVLVGLRGPAATRPPQFP